MRSIGNQMRKSSERASDVIDANSRNVRRHTADRRAKQRAPYPSAPHPSLDHCMRKSGHGNYKTYSHYSSIEGQTITNRPTAAFTPLLPPPHAPKALAATFPTYERAPLWKRMCPQQKWNEERTGERAWKCKRYSQMIT